MSAWIYSRDVIWGGGRGGICSLLILKNRDFLCFCLHNFVFFCPLPPRKSVKILPPSGKNLNDVPDIKREKIPIHQRQTSSTSLNVHYIQHSFIYYYNRTLSSVLSTACTIYNHTCQQGSSVH